MSHTIRRGLRFCSAAAESPSRAAAPGAKFCTNTSVWSSSRATTSPAARLLRSSAKLSLEWFTHTKCEHNPLTQLS
jgi:hypothetical protein